MNRQFFKVALQNNECGLRSSSPSTVDNTGLWRAKRVVMAGRREAIAADKVTLQLRIGTNGCQLSSIEFCDFIRVQQFKDYDEETRRDLTRLNDVKRRAEQV